MPREKQIPDKMYFRIGETADLLGVKPYVLRYWETEFPDIKPVKSQSNQRLYKRRDVELLLAVKHLLYDEKFTINGARQHLKDMMRGHEPPSQPSAPVKGKAKAASEDAKKLLSKLKGELQWCLTEMRK